MALLDLDILVDANVASRFSSIWISGQGYPRVSVGKQKEKDLHRLLAEEALGRELKRGEQVHHVNMNRKDCRRENLVVCPDQFYHQLLHSRTKYLEDGYSPETHSYCTDCKTYHTKESFPKNRNKWNGVSNVCKDMANTRRKKSRKEANQ